MAEKKNDRALRFYNEVLGLERLHYGLWQPDDALTFDNLKAAQQRYEDLLTQNIPKGTKTVLDVGCGTGVMAAKLHALGYEVEGLTPDVHQKKIIEKQAALPLNYCRFEHFIPTKTYDCIIMSESAQYIPLDRLFSVARQAISKNGHLMVCDYFVLNHARGIMAKSGHNYDAFLSTAKAANFELIQSRDITDQTIKTLEMGDNFCRRGLLALDIATEKIRDRYPRISRLAIRLLAKKFKKLTKQRVLLDAELFKASKRYQFLLFRSG